MNQPLSGDSPQRVSAQIPFVNLFNSEFNNISDLFKGCFEILQRTFAIEQAEAIVFNDYEDDWSYALFSPRQEKGQIEFQNILLDQELLSKIDSLNNPKLYTEALYLNPEVGREKVNLQHLILPVKSDNRILGAIALHISDEVEVSQDDLSFVSALGYEFGVALSNLQALGDIQISEVEQGALDVFNRKMLAVTDRAQLLELLQEQLQKIAFYQDLSITLVDPEEKKFYSFLTEAEKRNLEPGYDELNGTVLPYPNDFFENVLISESPYLYNLTELTNLREVPDYIKHRYKNGIKEILGTALLDGARPMGMLLLFSEKAGLFNTHKRRMIRQICNQLGAAIHNVRSREEQLERDRQNEVLLAVGKEIASVGTKEDLRVLIGDQLHTLFPYQDMVISIINEDSKIHTPFLFHNASMQLEREEYLVKSYPVDDGVYNKTMEAGGALVWNLAEMMNWKLVPEYIRLRFQRGNKVLVSISLSDKKENIGVLYFYSQHESDFTAAVVRLMHAVSFSIAVALSKLLAIERIKQQSDEKEILLALSKDIATIRDENSLLKMLQDRLKREIYINNTSISVLNEDKLTRTLLMSNGSERVLNHPEYKAYSTLKIPINDGIVDKALHSDEPVHFFLHDHVHQKATIPYLQIFDDCGIYQWVQVVLRNGNEPFGILSVQFETREPILPRHLRLLKEISYETSIAVSNILANREILKKEREKDQLLALSNAVALIHDKNHLLLFIHEKLKSLFLFNDIVITRLSEDNLSLLPFFIDSDPKRLGYEHYHHVVNRSYPVHDGIQNLVMESNTPVVFSIADLNSEHAPEYIKFIYETGLQEFVGVPLRARNEVIGALFVFYEIKGSFQKIPVDFFNGVANLLGLALGNILDNEQIQARKAETELLLSFSTELGSIRNRADLAKILKEQLAKMNFYTDISITMADLQAKKFWNFLDDSEQPRADHPDYERLVASTYSYPDGVFEIIIDATTPMVFEIEELVKEGRVPVYIQVIHDYGVKELVSVVMRDGDKKIGAIFFCSPEKKAFSNREFHLVQGIANQLAPVVANILANEMITSQLEEISSYKQQLEEENQYLQEEIKTAYNYANIVGSSMDMQKVFHLISQVAGTDSTVLILGETGTGKELIARAIHETSPRKDKIMVKVNCATLPATLVESELFGHERGSFTGATDRRIGKFELANKGTLFLDEVGELPLELQSKLLRALQEREIERVGGRSTIKVDVRIIAATNKNLQEEVAKGKFRADLFYRLNIFPVTLPPLRARRDDIPSLATHFLIRYAHKFGKNIRTISNSALQELLNYSWPGNIRELEHLIERSVLLAQGTSIKEVDLPNRSERNLMEAEMDDYRIKTIDENERDHIFAVLKRCSGKISGVGGAAELLGVPATTLNSKLKKLGITREHLVSGKLGG
jgi:formate hydrogenlyase transcriptional activator